MYAQVDTDHHLLDTKALILLINSFVFSIPFLKSLDWLSVSEGLYVQDAIMVFLKMYKELCSRLS